MAIIIVDDAFGNRLTDALNDAAVDLPLGQHRIDKIAEIVNHGISIHGHNTGVGVDLNFAHMRAIGEGARLKRGGRGEGQKVVAPGLPRHLRGFEEGWRHVRRADAELFVVKGDVVLCHALRLGQERAVRGDHRINRLQRYICLNCDRPRAPRATAPRDQVAVTLDEADFICWDAGLIGQELHKHRFVPLPVGLRAHVNRRTAIVVKGDLYVLGRRTKDAFDVVAQPHTAQFACSFGRGFARRISVSIREIGNAIQHAVEIAHIVGFAGGRHIGKLVCLDEIDSAQFPRINAEFACGAIDQAFDKIDRLGPTRPAIGVNLRRVGVDSLHPQIAGLNIVDAHQNLGKKICLDGLGEVRVVGAHIGGCMHTVGGDAVLIVKRHLGDMPQVAASIVRKHRFSPVRHPAHGAAQFAGGKAHKEVFGVRHGFHPEAAAGVGVGDADIRFVHVQNAREVGFLAPDALCVDCHVQASILHFGVTAAWFHRVGDDAVVLNPEADCAVCLGKSLLRRRLIAHAPVEGDVVGCLRMDCVPPRGNGEVRGQVFGIKRDQFRRIAGLLQGFGDNEHKRFADKAHAVFGQQRAERGCALGAVAVGNCCAPKALGDACGLKIGAGEYHVHALSRFGITGIEVGNFRVCHLGAQDVAVQGAVRRDVIHIAAVAGQKSNVFGPGDRLRFAELFHVAPCSVFCGQG